MSYLSTKSLGRESARYAPNPSLHPKSSEEPILYSFPGDFGAERAKALTGTARRLADDRLRFQKLSERMVAPLATVA